MKFDSCREVFRDVVLGDRARYKDDLFTVLAQVDLFLKSINKPLSVVALQRDLQQSQ
ncbi:hypothetical protein LINGRAHAP2_LOCUS6512, partial [Linum grandiflorum]